MNGVIAGGCGCLGFLALPLLAVPALLLDGGPDASASGAAAIASTVASDEQVVEGGGDSCDAAVRCQRIPSQIPYVPSGFFPDAYSNPGGQCTSWAAALWPGHRGRGVTWSGDGWDWLADAAAQGYAVSAVPTVGAVVVFRRTPADAGEWGHVAVVIGVTDTAVRVTEMNHAGRFVVDERTVALSDPLLTGFIPVPADGLSP